MIRLIHPINYYERKKDVLHKSLKEFSHVLRANCAGNTNRRSHPSWKKSKEEKEEKKKQREEEERKGEKMKGKTRKRKEGVRKEGKKEKVRWE